MSSSFITSRPGHVDYHIWGKEVKTNLEYGGMWANSVDPYLAVLI